MKNPLLHNHFIVDETKRQTINYNLPGMPILFGELNLKDIPNHGITGHWHKDLEFIIILRGKMTVGVNGTVFSLRTGDGIIIYSNQIHFLTASEDTDCQFLSMVISPALLTSGADLYAHYIKKSYFDAFYLSSQNPAQKDILEDNRRLFQLCRDQDSYYELYARGMLFQIWAQVCRLVPAPQSKTKKAIIKSDCLKEMLYFIHTNYRRPLTLDEICRAGAVSKSVCCRMFNEFLLLTPFAYLMQYRVEQSLIALGNPEVTIAEVAYENGFSGASYYAEVFRKFYGMSPSEYRRSYPTFLLL